MRLQRLGDLLKMLKAEIGDSVSVGTARDAELRQLLSNKQEFLASEFDWPFLGEDFDITITSRYSDLPTTRVNEDDPVLNIERPIAEVTVRWNTYWYPVEYGIGAEEYNAMDPDTGQTWSPIQRWQLYGQEQFEVWPLPESGQIIRFSGQRKPNVLAGDEDKADLDGLLIVLFCAADLLAGRPAGQTKAALATQRLARLRAVAPSRERQLVFGRCERDSARETRRVVPITVA